MKQAFFLTGTDTEIGKTFITCALLYRAQQLGLSVTGVKPIAAGIAANGRNDDVENIRAASNVELPDASINPYCFSSPIAPHIAAAEENIEIDFSVINAACQLARQTADFVIIEGVGGFCVPLGVDRDTADLAITLDLPLILVVGIRLGCINHALLTVEAIKRRGLKLAGWVANTIDPEMAKQPENLQTLRRLIAAPLLGVVPFGPKNGALGAADFLQIPSGF